MSVSVPLGAVTTIAVGAPATLDGVAQALAFFGIEGATLLPSVGFWKGIREDSVTIRLAGLPDSAVDGFAEFLLKEFSQESVYVERNGSASLIF